MRKFMPIVMIVLLATVGVSWGQYYKIKWTCDSSRTIQNSWGYAPQYGPSPIPNYNKYDLENDGVSEIITGWNHMPGPGQDSANLSAYVADIYDGVNYNLKNRIKKRYIFNSHILSLEYFWGFYDVDGDGVRESVWQGEDSLGNYNYQPNVIFLNVATDQIEYAAPFWDAHYINFSDIDNDGYPELITDMYILGHSATPAAQPAALPKRIVPTSKIFPNPIVGSAGIEYYVPTASLVKISIFNASGRLIRTLVNGNKRAGNYLEMWDGKSDDGMVLAAGQYLYNIQIGDFVTNKKVIMLQ